MSYLPRIAGDYLDSILSSEELSYYARHLLLPGIGAKGQQKLKTARVLVVGAGGLGCPVLVALIGAGVGQLTIVDGDVVSIGNLARQWLYAMKDVGQNKSSAARAVLSARNPFVRIDVVEQMFDAGNAESLVAAHDLVVDATDDAEARYLIDSVCAKQDRPWVHGALYREGGQVAVFWDRCAARYTGLYPQKSAAPSCAGAGVLGATASMIGNLQAMEVIKLITGSAQPAIGSLRVMDTTSQKLSQLVLPGIHMPELLEDAVFNPGTFGIEVESLHQRISIGESFRVIDVREPARYDEGHLPGAENCPLEELLNDPSIADTADKVLLYCEEGAISALLADALRSRGLQRVFNLVGGYSAWK